MSRGCFRRRGTLLELGRGVGQRVVLAAACACSGADRSTLSAIDPVVPVALDENPAPDVVEVTLRAGLGSKQYAGAARTSVWTYNDSVPGPLIEGRVGDRLRVHFSNELPEDTTIHWHGLRLPAEMDGTLAVQSPVPAGGTFEYEFELKDAGLFWFHPHVRSDLQVEKGLHGVLRVTGEGEPEVDERHVLVLDDVRILADGTLPEYLDDESRMLGRQGNILLVNGVSQPTFRWRSGTLQRLQIVNVANGRFFNLELPGYSWRVIGTDGGFIPQPYDTELLLISPGERYDVVLVATGSPGTEVTLMNEPYERGHGTGNDPALALAKFVVNDEPALDHRPLPSEFPALERLGDGPTDHEMTLDEGFVDGVLAFTINGDTYPNVPPLIVPAGQVRRLEVRNTSEMDHPFHLHGTFFQVLDVDGRPTLSETLANKDTVIVPQRSAVRLVSRFQEPGRWMYHCHIFEHAEGGMMGEIEVAEQP